MNLQQLPATGTKYAKLIKKCFAAPDGWLFCGLDFSSLEDRISALTTKDPNKLAVYEKLNKYDLYINGCHQIIFGDTILSYDGKQITGDELYAILQNSKP